MLKSFKDLLTRLENELRVGRCLVDCFVTVYGIRTTRLIA